MDVRPGPLHGLTDGGSHPQRRRMFDPWLSLWRLAPDGEPVVARAAGLERTRLPRWILAYAGLSAAWSLEDGDEPALALVVAELAAAELGP